MTDFWGGFWLGVFITVIVWGFSLRRKPDSRYDWSKTSNWHPDYREPKRAPRVLKRTEKK